MPGRYKVFKYLDNKSIETIDLVSDHPLYDPLDPYKLYNYLNNIKIGYNEYPSNDLKNINIKDLKTKNCYKSFKNLDKKDIEAFKFVEEQYRHTVFQYLDKKEIKAFKMIPEEYRAEIFNLLSQKDMFAFELIPEYDRCFINGEPFKFIDYQNLDIFKLIPLGRQHLVFQYLKINDILEAFKLVQNDNKYKVFKYLKVKDLEAFKLIPENDRYKAFKDLEVKDLEAFNLISGKDRYQALEYLDRESINNFKIMVCNGEDLDAIFKNSNDDKLNKLKPGYIKFVPRENKNNYYKSDSHYVADESSENDFKLLRNYLNNTSIDFEKIPEQCRWCVFSYVDNKNVESFKLVPEEDRFCCFRYLDKKTYEAFNLIAYEDRFRCFEYLDEKTKKALDCVYSEDKKLIINKKIIEPEVENEEVEKCDEKENECKKEEKKKMNVKKKKNHN